MIPQCKQKLNKTIKGMSVDLDDYTEEGRYYVAATSSTRTNFPGTCMNGFLEVYNYSDVTKQIFYRRRNYE